MINSILKKFEKAFNRFLIHFINNEISKPVQFTGKIISNNLVKHI